MEEEEVARSLRSVDAIIDADVLTAVHEVAIGSRTITKTLVTAVQHTGNPVIAVNDIEYVHQYQRLCIRWQSI